MVKNLIAVSQIRPNELSGYVSYITSGFVVPYVSGVSGSLRTYTNGAISGLSGYVTGLSGALAAQIAAGAVNSGLLNSGIRTAITSGVDTITVNYGFSYPRQPKVAVSIETTGVSNPYLLPNILANRVSGCIIGLSDIARSPFYNLDLIVSV